MYKTDSYYMLSECDVAALNYELKGAQSKLDYYIGYLNGEFTHEKEPIDYEFGYKGIKSCEQYIIEIERRLGAYNALVSNMLKRWRHKALQSRGVQLSKASVSDTPTTKTMAPVLRSIKSFDKFKKFKKESAA